MKILGSPKKSGVVQCKSWGLQRKSGVSNENMEVSNKIWGLQWQLRGLPRKSGVSNEMIGVSN